MSAHARVVVCCVWAAGLVAVGGTLTPVAAGEEPTTTQAARPIPAAAEMQKEVERLRGERFLRPVDIDVYTEAQMRAFIQDPFEAKAEQRRREELGQAALRMVGLIPPDCNLPRITESMLAGLVPPGIYNHRTHELRVLERADGNYGGFDVRLTLVHELTHALDDQLFDLTKTGKEDTATSDEANVWGALVEGSGVTVQEQYRAAATAAGQVAPGEAQESMKSMMEQMRAVTEAPPVPGVFFARFPCGSGFLQAGARALQTRAAGGTPPPSSMEMLGVGPALREAFGDLPKSTEQILHPEKYWSRARRDAPAIVSDEDVERLFSAVDLRVVHKDTLGELLCAVVTSPADKRINPMTMAMPGYWTTPAATGWGGDRLYLLAPTGDEAAKDTPLRGAWLTAWDTPADRDEFVQAYAVQRALPSRVLLKLGGRGAIYFFGLDEAVVNALRSRLPANPPRLFRDGELWSE